MDAFIVSMLLSVLLAREGGRRCAMMNDALLVRLRKRKSEAKGEDPPQLSQVREL